VRHVPITDEQKETYSMWLSAYPLTGTVPWTISDDSFMFLGVTEGGFDFNINYGGTIKGIYGKHPRDAIYMDRTGGAVGQISATLLRYQPQNPDDRSTQIARDRGLQVGGVSLNNISNYAILEEFVRMRTTIQLRNNAYVLRIYRGFGNAFFKQSGGQSDPRIPSGNANKGYVQYPIYLTKAEGKFIADRPNEITVTISATMRNPWTGLENIEYLGDTST